MSDTAGKEHRRRSPAETPMWNNWMTETGMILTILALLGLFTFGLFSVIAPADNPYVDVIGFMIVPGLLALGLILMPLGTLLKSWRLRRQDPTQRLVFRFPRINLNDPDQRRVAKIVVAITVVVLPVMAVSAYHGYHFTDSVEFCGTTCHTVMEPQYTTFLQSSHARVACAECHIGAGAGWFVKSKLSGTRQVVAVTVNSFSRPIPPAITELRPARETCEECHWPQRFFGSQLQEITRYRSDEANTPRRISMLIKTGGAGETFAASEGIHRHIALEGHLEYVATDEHLQEIPWVQWTDPDGEVLIYRSDGKSADDPPPVGERRGVDCMDCHNRAAHKFESPQQAVDEALSAGVIDASLPYVKREAVAALLAAGDAKDGAHDGIAEYLMSFYRDQYPQVASTQGASVQTAIQATQDIYGRTFFPKMNVDWRTYPDNVGHFFSPGCFRCHDGKHVNQHGVAISHACSNCHTFFNENDENGETMLSHGEFQHPFPLEGAHAGVECFQCHTGGASPTTSCEECHVEQQSLYAAQAPYLEELGIDPEPNYMFESAYCEDCHDTSVPASVAAVRERCVVCHEDESYGEILDDWISELKDARDAVDQVVTQVEGLAGGATWAQRAREILGTLQTAGDQHNPDMALEVYSTLQSQGEELIASGGEAPSR